MFKKNINRAISLMLVVVLLMSFAACSKNEKGNIEDLSDDEIEEIFNEIESENSVGETLMDDSSSHLNTADAINVAFTSGNGYGKVEIDVNRWAFSSAVSTESLINYINSVNPSFAESIIRKNDNITLVDILSFKQSPENKRLSNGDVTYIAVGVADELAAEGITLEMVERQFGISFERTLQYTVAGLPQGTAINVFEIIGNFLKYSGGNGGGKIEINIPSDYYKEINGCYFKGVNTTSSKSDVFNIVYNNTVIGKYRFSVKKVTDNNMPGFAAGDIFGIKILPLGNSFSYSGAYEDYINQQILTSGFFFSDVELFYAAPNFGEYINSYSELTVADLDMLENIVVNDEKETFATVELLGSYSGNIKPFAVTDNNSKFVLLVAVFCKHNIGYHDGSYKAIGIQDIVRKPDGSLEYNIADFDLFAIEDTMEELESRIYSNTDYDFVKIR